MINSKNSCMFRTLEDFNITTDKFELIGVVISACKKECDKQLKLI